MLDILNEWRSLPPHQIKTIQCEVGHDCILVQVEGKPFYLELKNRADHANLQQALQEAIAQFELRLTLEYYPALKVWEAAIADYRSIRDLSTACEWRRTDGELAIALLRAYVDCLKGLAENQMLVTGGDR